MTTTQALELFLKTKFNNEQNSFTKIEKDFLLQYSIEKKYTSPNNLLKDLGQKIGEQKFYAGHPHVKTANQDLQNMYRLFKLKNKYSNAFNDSFADFIAWWCSECDPSTGARRCCYCGVDENTTSAALRYGLIHSEKKSFNTPLQIERIRAGREYSSDNCHFACTLCNNAKSDMVSSEDFKKYIAPGIAAYWQHLKEKLPR